MMTFLVPACSFDSLGPTAKRMCLVIASLDLRASMFGFGPCRFVQMVATATFTTNATCTPVNDEGDPSAHFAGTLRNVL